MSRRFQPPLLRSEPDAAAETLEGTLERFVYRNEESGWSVVRLAVPRRREAITAVGPLLAVQPGESLRLTGRWVSDPRHGLQFRVDSYLTLRPATLMGIEKYPLGSGLVKGIGRGMAGRLVGHFGLGTLEVIDHQPERLTEVEGIGPVRAKLIRQAWAEQREIREVMLFLQSHGVTTAYAVRIFRAYGARAAELVRENPYRLAVDIWGIGFRTADRIAARLGIDPASPRRAEAGLLHLLGRATEEGHVFLPRPRLVEAAVELLGIERGILEEGVETLAREERVVVEADGGEGEPAVYLKSLHVCEAGGAALLRRLLEAPAPALPIDIPRALAWFEKEEGIVLAERQREAVRRAIGGRVLVITGGPGTGKTTLVRAVLRILEKKGLRILLAAPTGRAAKRLQEATGREAATIHRLLEFSPAHRRFERHEGRPLETDLLVLDEVSMVDVSLLYSLLKALPPACRLLLVGDVDQLPSVGPGSVLRDIILSAAVETVRLEEIFRQARESLIVLNAHRVNQGKLPELGPAAEGADFFFIERNDPAEALETIKELVARRIPRRFGLDPRGEIQVLTPMHRGILGATSLNAELQALLNPDGEPIGQGGRSFRVGDRVMQVRNNYDLGVYNGDVGRIAAVDEEARELEVSFDERGVRYDLLDLEELVLAYACSVHKSQGSEYPAVVLPLDTQHYLMLQRNLLYTAITRGKRLVVLVGSRRAVARAVRNERLGRRFSRLAERLRSPASFAKTWC